MSNVLAKFLSCAQLVSVTSTIFADTIFIENPFWLLGLWHVALIFQLRSQVLPI
jgi:hypothetical protein